MDKPLSQLAQRVTFSAKWREVGWSALATALLMWAAHPPLGLSWLAWIAPIGLLRIVARDAAPRKLGYFCVWLAGCVFWLLILQGIRLAYWPLYFGWLALSLYLAVYFPLFVAVSRHLVHRCRWPLMLAAPIVWTGCELGRSYILTGYAASTLAHSQYRQPIVIQLADQIGGYGISFIMMCVAVLVYRCRSILPGLTSRSAGSSDPTISSNANSAHATQTALDQMTDAPHKSLRKVSLGEADPRRSILPGLTSRSAGSSDPTISSNANSVHGDNVQDHATQTALDQMTDASHKSLRKVSLGEADPRRSILPGLTSRSAGSSDPTISSTTNSAHATQNALDQMTDASHKSLRKVSLGEADLREIIFAGGLLTLLLVYGYWRLYESNVLARDAKPLLRVALIQENTPSMFDADPGRLVTAWDRYAEMTVQALKHAGHASGQPVDIVAWPESTFTGYSTELHCGITWMENKIVDKVPAEMAANNWDKLSIDDLVSRLQREFRSKVAVLHGAIAAGLPAASTSPSIDNAAGSPKAITAPYLLVGNDTVHFTDNEVGKYNAALLVDPDGAVINRYEKIHLVMFGEYVPLGFVLKPIADAFGLVCTHGTSPKVFEVKGVRLAPSICFESMMPQVMSWLVRTLKARGEDPHVLINVTNDSWFRGSSILDHHLACEVLAAVELRRPFLIAANTGLTAWIDGSGRIVQQTKRLEPGFVIAEPIADSRFGLTQVWGDFPAWCLAMIVLGAIVHRLGFCR